MSCSHIQLSVMNIAEGREEQPHWVVRREEVELTEEVHAGQRRMGRSEGCHVSWSPSGCKISS